ncbi:hypothetical protein PYCCODRAFT_1438323 [Trametes coccinea BRFM310]|uniref:Fungal N-terminal domain-containing protein n=1 Tax=Trametes coccinea (strain BRFM310) TaxID=1353009 RepID=A0A1Y2IE05_TRAC3|nr:hypothetical protein PYCCODRAFT_1438323 [Trametes coccinea BRFM310]
MSLTQRRVLSVARCRPALETVKASLMVLSKIPTPVPGLQTALETVVQIIQYAEAAKHNKADAKELASSAARIVEVLVQTITDSKTEKIDGDFKRAVAEFHRELARISTTMQSLAEQTTWRRLLKKEDHSKAIEEHKRALADAIILFQIKESISSRQLMVKQHRELQDSIGTLSTRLTRAEKPEVSTVSFKVDLPFKHTTLLYVQADVRVPVACQPYFFF